MKYAPRSSEIHFFSPVAQKKSARYARREHFAPAAHRKFGSLRSPVKKIFACGAKKPARYARR